MTVERQSTPRLLSPNAPCEIPVPLATATAIHFAHPEHRVFRERLYIKVCIPDADTHVYGTRQKDLRCRKRRWEEVILGQEGSRQLVALVASRFLIADDNPTVRRMLRALLETHEGWLVCGEAENGLEAVAKASELRPDVVVLDLAMPVMDGLRATREISAALPGVPILIHTLHNAPGVELEAKKSGACRIINKTESADELLRAIEEALGGAMQRESVQPAASRSAELKTAASGAGNGSSDVPAASDELNGGAKPN